MKMRTWLGLAIVAALAGTAGAGIIYQDNFTGAAGSAHTSVPEVAPPDGYTPIGVNMGIDGNGLLEATANNSNANLRFALGNTPLTADPNNTSIALRFTLRTPNAGWIGLGFHGVNALNLTFDATNPGPALFINSSLIRVLSGGTGGSESAAYAVAAGTVVTGEMLYDVAAGTVDLTIGGSLVIDGFVLDHYFEGTQSAPVVQYLQAHLRLQPTASAGGAYIDSLEVEVIPEPATLGLFAVSSVLVLLARRCLMR